MDLLQGFRHQSQINPTGPCLVEGETILSYAQTARRAGGIARAVQSLALAPNRPVAIAAPKGIEAACAVLGILAAGHAYLPLDMKGPEARRRQILSESQVSAIAASDAKSGAGDLPVLVLDQIQEADFPSQSVSPATIAAILYTSGSTGTPKGVALSHSAIHAFSQWVRRLVQLSPKDRIAAIAPLHFDLSTFDLFSVLSAGACIDFLPDTLTSAPSRLTEWLETRKITGFYSVPSLLSFWAWKGNLKKARLNHLRFILFAGEPFPTPQLRELANSLPAVELHNLYGPTETNVCCHWPVDRARLSDDQPIPIGKPACGNELRIDSDSSELQVNGPTLFSGYWQRGKLTPALTDDGWYRTGDLVSINALGEFVWHGRLDRMVKIAGHRVEPAEVEAALSGLEGVKQCTVVAIAGDLGMQLAAAVVLDQDLSIARIRQLLNQQLPQYMIPSRWRTCAFLPRLNNGKLDLQAVEKLFSQRPPANITPAASSRRYAD